MPDGVAAAESFGDPPEARLLPEEEAAVRNAVDKRRREFTTTRHCARIAMAELGLPPVAVLSGGNREPLWPAGVVGSMTHCDGYRAAALGRDTRFASIGIDAEPHEPLPGDVLPTIARPEEIPWLRDLAAGHPDVQWDRLLFSAKESVYKAWYPVARAWLGFEEATLRLDPASRTFDAEIHRDGPIARMTGRWLVADGIVLTSVVVEAA